MDHKHKHSQAFPQKDSSKKEEYPCMPLTGTRNDRRRELGRGTQEERNNWQLQREKQIRNFISCPKDY